MSHNAHDNEECDDNDDDDVSSRQRVIMRVRFHPVRDYQSARY